MKTKRIRAAVVISPDGQYIVHGNGEYNDHDLGELASEMLDLDGYSLHFVEADVPIPEPQTVEGRVE